MELEGNIKEIIEKEAKEISETSEYDYDDALSAMTRSYQYALDVGETGEAAFDKAQEIVGEALMGASRMGFELRGAVDHLLFSMHHRTPSRGAF